MNSACDNYCFLAGVIPHVGGQTSAEVCEILVRLEERIDVGFEKTFDFLFESCV